MWKALEYHGVGGVVHFALSATDIAIWDIIGKAAGVPVWKLLGAYRDRMPVYSMCGWYYDNDKDLSHYKKSMVTAFEQGYRAIKIKVGRYDLDDDIRRVRMAIDLAGKGRRVMLDANQIFNRNEALRRGRVYQDMGCFWYEEPLPAHDMGGYAELAAKLDIRIATGENLYTKYAFADLISHKGADVVQPDNRRAGGVTEWMEIAAIADAYGLELASHGGGSANMNMLVAMPNAIYIKFPYRRQTEFCGRRSDGPHRAGHVHRTRLSANKLFQAARTFAADIQFQPVRNLDAPCPVKPWKQFRDVRQIHEFSRLIRKKPSGSSNFEVSDGAVDQEAPFCSDQECEFIVRGNVEQFHWADQHDSLALACHQPQRRRQPFAAKRREHVLQCRGSPAIRQRRCSAIRSMVRARRSVSRGLRR
ncbi:MAG: mandelate racemase/muconate lactonizing enzyme family protein [Paludibaculum sp.]